MARLTQNGHGGNVYAASRELHRPIDRIIDFSASINPLGSSPAVWRAIAKARQALHHYPDPDCWTLRQVLASRWRRRLEEIVVGNGSSELIHALPLALGLRHLLVIGPTFSEYAAAMARAGGRVTMVLADRTEGYVPPLDRASHLLQAQKKDRRRRSAIDAVVLCNPNSPTGQACEAEDVIKFSRAAARRGVRVILDETFAEYCGSRSILSRSASMGWVIVLRSLTKFHALPGLRVGYAVADQDVVQRIRACQAPWSVNALAQAAAVAALQDDRHAKRSLSYMVEERARLTASLSKLSGCLVLPSHANFLLVELPDAWSAGDVTALLRRQGLLIRDCSAVPGLHARCVRIAVRTRRENNRLAKALSSLLARR